MLAKVCSAAVNGIEAYPVDVEVNAGYGRYGDRNDWADLTSCERFGSVSY